MPSYSFKMPRLYLDAALSVGTELELDKQAANYLVNVMRLDQGAAVLVFNGHEGEWRADLIETSKRKARLLIMEATRAQTPPSTIDYLFAPLKHARLDYMVQKAVEMGVGRLRPVLTEHTQVTRVNTERMAANVIEACEQCGVLSVPSVEAPDKFDRVLANWAAEAPEKPLLFCDERADGLNAVAALNALKSQGAGPFPKPLALGLLIGPEGGFSPREREHLKAHAFVHILPLGPRILRADTAGVAALAVVQAVLGDWQG